MRGANVIDNFCLNYYRRIIKCHKKLLIKRSISLIFFIIMTLFLIYVLMGIGVTIIILLGHPYLIPNIILFIFNPVTSIISIILFIISNFKNIFWGLIKRFYKDFYIGCRFYPLIAKQIFTEEYGDTSFYQDILIIISRYQLNFNNIDIEKNTAEHYLDSMLIEICKILSNKISKYLHM